MSTSRPRRPRRRCSDCTSRTMRRRLAVMLLAVALGLASAIQLGIEPANSQTPTPTSTESPAPTTSPSAPCAEQVNSLCTFTGTVVLSFEGCPFLDTGSDRWIGPLAGPLGFQLQPSARVRVTGSWRNDLPTICSTPFNALFVVSAVEILSPPTAVPTVSPPTGLATPVATSAPLPAELPASGA